jgi:structural maintenance of chromosome 1
MKQRFPGDVLGRLCDICETRGAQYNVAVAVLMGRQMDSVVVRTLAVAKACVELLRGDKREPMEFIPLDHVQARSFASAMQPIACQSQPCHWDFGAAWPSPHGIAAEHM